MENQENLNESNVVEQPECEDDLKNQHLKEDKTLSTLRKMVNMEQNRLSEIQKQLLVIFE